MKHTSKLIIGSTSNLLDGKKVTLCITGSVAAVESVHIARLLMRHGAEVYCVMSHAGTEIIHPHLMEWATGNPVVTRLTGQIEHITLAGKHDEHVDLVLIAPSTANTIGKVANGIDDTTVTTTVSSAIGAGIPVMIVPAMHKSMYDHPAVLENIDRLKKMGVDFISPRIEEAKAKISDVETIVDAVIGRLGPKDLENKHFVLTAGPTRGWFDDVRFITNPSTGKMGIALAKEIIHRGGEVTLILGPSCVDPPSDAKTIRVETTDEMLDAVTEEIDKDSTVFISSAAVLDYIPSEVEEGKRPSGEEFEIKLKPTPKIINEVRGKYKDLFIVGFKVESGVTDKELEARARMKIDSDICNLVVANDAKREGVAFGTDTNQVIVVGPKGYSMKMDLASKREIARGIIDIILEKLAQ
ncbi:MAG: bifunctional phosphopantothenoylcysteine decarboxylase/phosphopantothenate--cysteine ligase CoaBC [Candidatus Thorarchaeota archaeon]|nr:bifunctional phosphopantothenoylcysteine decarboxylase/phosphopantothenate--cysteine ligase CoaBC [Candidatus Thorarchaeota archaeon]